MIKGSIQQENITILNAYPPNNRAVKYVKQKLMEVEIKLWYEDALLVYNVRNERQFYIPNNI